jgi:hypothetical protein
MGVHDKTSDIFERLERARNLSFQRSTPTRGLPKRDFEGTPALVNAHEYEGMNYEVHEVRTDLCFEL